MKKLLYTFIAISFTSVALLAQDDSKSVRFGVFGRATPTWYSMPTNNNYSKGGAIFGAGFGLNMEFRVTNVVSFQTGVGGDFDGGKIKYVDNNLGYANTNNYFTGYYLDKTPALVEIKGTSPSDPAYNNGTTTAHFLTSRQIHTTYVTIPLILKMKTKEISGFKYFVDFGANVGVLASAKSDDNTNDLVGYTITGVPITTSGSNKGLSIYKDCNPVRVGLNVGGGAEYRLAGTTSIFLSVNYVNSFISTVKTTSVYNATGVTTNSNNQSAFVYASQSFKTNGIQVNVGFLF
jgi:hypothetical protein